MKEKFKRNTLKKNIRNERRVELEKELEIQKKNINSVQYPDMSPDEIDHLNYYNEIAQQNIRYVMNSPTMKEIKRVTSDESCLEQLKKKLQSKELQKLLEQLPLMRVERINIKNKQIGHMRKDLAKYSQPNIFTSIDEKKGKEFASNIYTRRIKEGEKYVRSKHIDSLYNDENTKQLNRTPNFYDGNNKLTARNRNISDIWTTKNNTCLITKKNENKNNNVVIKKKDEKLNRRHSCGLITKINTYNKYNRNNKKINIIINNENQKVITRNEKKNINKNINQLETSEKTAYTFRGDRKENHLRHNSIVTTNVPEKEERIKLNFKKQFKTNDNYASTKNKRKSIDNTNNNHYHKYYNMIRRKLDAIEKK